MQYTKQAARKNMCTAAYGVVLQSTKNIFFHILPDYDVASGACRQKVRNNAAYSHINVGHTSQSGKQLPWLRLHPHKTCEVS